MASSIALLGLLLLIAVSQPGSSSGAVKKVPGNGVRHTGTNAKLSRASHREDPYYCDCNDPIHAPVCGSDHSSYPSECTLLCYKRWNPSLTLLHKGECKVKGAPVPAGSRVKALKKSPMSTDYKLK